MKFAIVSCLFGLALSENLHGRSAFSSSCLGQYGSDPRYGTNIGYFPNLGYSANFPHGSTLGYRDVQGYNGWQGYRTRFNTYDGYNGDGLSAYGTNSAYSRPPISLVSQPNINTAKPVPYSSQYGVHGDYHPSTGYGY